MGWEKRGNGMFYYTSVRVDGQPRKIYWGNGIAGRAHEQADRLAVLRRKESREQKMLVRGPIKEADRLWTQLWLRLRLLAETHLLLAGWYRHRGQWHPARRSPRSLPKQTRIESFDPKSDPWTHLRSLNARAIAREVGSHEALQAFRAEHPEMEHMVADLIRQSEELWQKCLGDSSVPGAGIEESIAGLEGYLKAAVGLAERNREHAGDLSTSIHASGLAITTRLARVERADKRVADARRLLERIRKAGSGVSYQTVSFCSSETSESPNPEVAERAKAG